jgi:enterochelin esterase-like enzyme
VTSPTWTDYAAQITGDGVRATRVSDDVVRARGKAIEAMRADGASWREIERATGYGHSTIRYWLARYHKLRNGDA